MQAQNPMSKETKGLYTAVKGYILKSAITHLRSVCTTPILTGLPFGHVPTKVMLPVGARVQLVVQGRDVLIGW